jgi:hypothetical protein
MILIGWSVLPIVIGYIINRENYSFADQFKISFLNVILSIIGLVAIIIYSFMFGGFRF